MAFAKKESWFFLPAVAEYFYKNHDPNYRKPPSFMEGCDNAIRQKNLAIIYPKSNSQLFIPLNFEEVNEAVFFEATHINEKINLYWHLDDTFIGTTKGIHQLKYMPSTGKHRLTVIDENGVSEMVIFEVTVSGN